MDIKLEFLMGETAIVSSVEVNVNEEVKAGDELLQYEASKGIIPILSPEDGIIEEICVKQGDIISLNDVLFKLNTGMEQKTADFADNKASKRECSEIKADLIVIGAGPGGYEAAIYAAQNKLKVILVEAGEVGGTCLNEGCIPTKAMNKSASVYDEIRKASDLGIEVSEVSVNISRVIDRKDEVKRTLISGIHSLLMNHGIELIKGTARFQSEHTVLVEQQDKDLLIDAKHIIVATGSKTVSLNIPGIELPNVMDSTAALSLKEIPDSITIIGGGVIGMEFAFIYNCLGVQVQVIEYAGSILPMLDYDISDRVKVIANRKGISIQTNAKVSRIEQGLKQEAIIIYEKDGKEQYAVSEKVLMAVGRIPNYENLDIEKAGIEALENRRGIRVNDYMQTNQPSIYAIGDVTNIIQLAHVASHQGITSVKNILGHKEKMDYQVVPNVIFTMPEVATVGKTEIICQKEKIPYEVYKFPFAANGKALILDDSVGFVKLIKNSKTNALIGGAIIGPDASTLINSVTELIQYEITQEQASRIIFPHPTTGEAIMECIMGLGLGAIHSVNQKEGHE